MNLKTTSTALFEYGKYMTSTQNVQLYNFLKFLFWKLQETFTPLRLSVHWFDKEQNTEKNLEDFAWILNLPHWNWVLDICTSYIQNAL